jgi:hypothetical protein
VPRGPCACVSPAGPGGRGRSGAGTGGPTRRRGGESGPAAPAGAAREQAERGSEHPRVTSTASARAPGLAHARGAGSGQSDARADGAHRVRLASYSAPARIRGSNNPRHPTVAPTQAGPRRTGAHRPSWLRARGRRTAGPAAGEGRARGAAQALGVQSESARTARRGGTPTAAALHRPSCESGGAQKTLGGTTWSTQQARS